MDGEDFFDTLAEDAVVEYVIFVPGYPRRVAGREAAERHRWTIGVTRAAALEH